MLRNDLVPLLADDSSDHSRGQVKLTATHHSRKMQYQVSVTKLKQLNLSTNQNRALAGSSKLDFFFAGGDEAKDQLQKDKDRGHILFNGKSLDEIPNQDDAEPAWSDPVTQIKAKLNGFFLCHQANTLIDAHSQGPGYFLSQTLSTAYADEQVIHPNITAIIGQSNAARINVYKKDNTFYQEMFVDEFPIFDPIDGKNKIIGYLRGPVRVTFKLENRKGSDNEDNWGYAVQSIESDNKDIIDIVCGNAPSNQVLQQRYCQHRQFAAAVQALEETIQDGKHQFDKQLKEQGINVLHAAKEAFYSKKAPANTITNILKDTNTLIKNPNSEDASIYRNNANAISKRPWGKILCSTMLILAGVALIAASTAIALISFGALAPVSILGFTLAASTIAGGTAIGTGVIGLSAAAGGTTLFACNLKNPGKKLALEITRLAKQVKKS